MKLPTIYGRPFTGISSRKDFDAALRQNDQQALHGQKGWNSDDFTAQDFFGGSVSILPGVKVNRFAGYSSYMQAGMRKVWATAHACELVANEVAGVPLVFQANGKEVKNAPRELLRLLKMPNDHYRLSQMIWALVWHLKITGNGYWLKDDMNGLGQPRALYWLNPAFVSYTPDAKTMIKRYHYKVNGREIDFEPEEIIHFRRTNPLNAALGLGEIEQGESLYDEFINRTLYNEKVWENGGAGGNVLVNKTPESTDDKQWEMARAKFMERYGGLRNAGKQAWLAGDWSLLKLGMTSAEMQALESKTDNVQDIFLNHNVPLSVAGYDAANYATAKVDEMKFRRNACKPLLDNILDTLNHEKNGLVPFFRPDLTVVGQMAGLIDVEAVLKEFGPMVEMGAMTPNELRAKAGLPKVNNPYLDQYFVKSSLVPIEVAGIASETPTGVQGDEKPTDEKPEDGEEPQRKPVKPGKKPGKPSSSADEV